MTKRNFPLSKVYRLLEPGPVVLVTTAGKDRANIMTMSWHTMLEFEPPLVGCVINIPAVELANMVVGVGNCSGHKVDKFKKFCLTSVAASTVRAPLIGECFANLECRVVDTKMVAKYNFFVLEVLKAWIDPAQKHPRTIHHQGMGVFAVDGETIRLPSKKK